MSAKYNVRVTLVAKADVKGILNYIRADRPAAADRFDGRFAERIKSLRYNPERFPKVREQFHTKFVYRYILVNSYRIIFRILASKSGSFASSIKFGSLPSTCYLALINSSGRFGKSYERSPNTTSFLRIRKKSA